MAISTASFTERLSRIEKERARAKGRIVLHVGADEVMVSSLDDLSQVAAVATVRRPSALVILIAVLVGGLAFAASVALRARFLPLPAPEAVLGDLPMLSGIAIGFMLCVFLAPILRLKGRTIWIAQAFGVVLAAMTLHNFAFWAPEQASLAFTPAWVDLQQAATEPDSIVFRAEIFAL